MASRVERPRDSQPVANVRSTLANDDSEFHVIENVPVFPEHSTEAKDGRWLVFDYAALKAVCGNCNRRIFISGDYATICIGHTPSPDALRAGKALTPRIVGFAGPFKMGLLGNKGAQRWCILARFRIFKDDWAEVRKYPRRSPELWLLPTYDQMFLDPIALLGAETPRQDMGLLYSAAYHAEGFGGVLVEKYAAAAPAPSASNVFVPSEDYRGASQGDQPMSSSTDEIVQAVVGALDSLDWVQWAKQQMQTAQSPAAMATAPPADANAPPPPVPTDPSAAGATPPVTDAAPPAAAQDAAPVAGPAATPPAAVAPSAPPVDQRKDAEPDQLSGVQRVKYSADDSEEPEVNEPPEGTLVADDDEDDDLEPEENETIEQYRARSRDHRRKRKGGAKINYSATEQAPGAAAQTDQITAVITAALAPLASRLDTLDRQMTRDRVGMKNVERYARLEALTRQGYAIDTPSLMEKLQYSATGEGGVSDDEFDRTIEILTKSGNRAPIDAPMLPIPDSIENYSATPGDKKAATAEQREKALKIAEHRAMNGQPADYVATLRDVVAGKA